MSVGIRPAVGDNITQGVASGAQCRRVQSLVLECPQCDHTLSYIS